MAFKIGFAAESLDNKTPETIHPVWQAHNVPRKSVVQVYFAGKNTTFAYYNDQFDLHPGDLVYVDGKLEGHRGRVTD